MLKAIDAGSIERLCLTAPRAPRGARRSRSGKRVTGRPSRGPYAELPEQMAGVPVDPASDDLAVPDLGNGASMCLSTAIRWRNPHEITAMGASGCVATHDVVATAQYLICREA